MEIDKIEMEILPSIGGRKHIRFTVYFTNGIITEIEREFTSNTLRLNFVEDLPGPRDERPGEEFN